MKKLLLGLAVAGAFAASQSANANIITLINDLNKNDIGNIPGNNGNGISTAALYNFVEYERGLYNASHDPDLPAIPTSTDSGPADGFKGIINIPANSYLALHYGGGRGGGGLVALFFDSATAFDVPDNGTGTYGDGGISSIALFAAAGPGPDTGSVPDGGTTVMLLGSSLSALGWLARSRKAKA